MHLQPDTMTASWLIFASTVALGLAVSEVAIFQDCDGVSDVVCKVNELHVDPCRKNAHCILKKGNNASMVVNFTPNFTATKLKIGLYWDNGAMDVLFEALETDDACTFTGCPTEAGKPQVLNYGLHIGSKLPKGTFMMKWKVWNAEDDTQICCFKTRIQLVNKKNKIVSK